MIVTCKQLTQAPDFVLRVLTPRLRSIRNRAWLSQRLPPQAGRHNFALGFKVGNQYL
jgi:hypothetical protein